MEPIIKLDRTEIERLIRLGDNCQGNRVLAVAPDGSGSEIHWLENNRQWDNCPVGWLTIGIPPLNPEGEAAEWERAEECLLGEVGREEAKRMIDELCEKDEALVDYVEATYPRSWEAWNEEAVSWLSDAFLNACNGRGEDLNRGDAPWGYEGDDYNDVEVTDPPAEFEWK